LKSPFAGPTGTNFALEWNFPLPDDFYCFSDPDPSGSEATIAAPVAGVGGIDCRFDGPVVINTTGNHPFRRHDLVAIEGGEDTTDFDEAWFNQCFEVTHGPGDVHGTHGTLTTTQFAIAFTATAIGYAINPSQTMTCHQAAFQLWYNFPDYFPGADWAGNGHYTYLRYGIVRRDYDNNIITGLNPTGNLSAHSTNKIISQGWSQSAWNGVVGAKTSTMPRDPVTHLGGHWLAHGIKSEDLKAYFNPTSAGNTIGWANKLGGHMVTISTRATSAWDIVGNHAEPLGLGPVVMSAHCAKVVSWDPP